MRTSCGALFLCLCLVITGLSQEQTATQDLKLTVRHMSHVSWLLMSDLPPIDTTYYFSRDNNRFETQLFSGNIKGHHRAIIQRRGLHKTQVYDLDLDAKEYAAYKEDLRPGPAPSKIKFSGKTVVVNFESVDTGERREIYGLRARHIVSTQKTAGRPENSNAGVSEVEMDGWYVDFDVFPTSAHQIGVGLLPPPVSVASIYHTDGSADKIEVHRTGPATGFPLQLKTAFVYKVTQPDGSSKRYTRIEEKRVVELSRAPLDARLFEVPPDFKKVDKIVDPTLHLEARSHWQRFKDRVRSVFR